MIFLNSISEEQELGQNKYFDISNSFEYANSDLEGFINWNIFKIVDILSEETFIIYIVFIQII